MCVVRDLRTVSPFDVGLCSLREVESKRNHICGRRRARVSTPERLIKARLRVLALAEEQRILK
jgi:hypothetical protein